MQMTRREVDKAYAIKSFAVVFDGRGYPVTVGYNADQAWSRIVGGLRSARTVRKLYSARGYFCLRVTTNRL